MGRRRQKLRFSNQNRIQFIITATRHCTVHTESSQYRKKTDIKWVMMENQTSLLNKGKVLVNIYFAYKFCFSKLLVFFLPLLSNCLFEHKDALFAIILREMLYMIFLCSVSSEGKCGMNGL